MLRKLACTDYLQQFLFAEHRQKRVRGSTSASRLPQTILCDFGARFVPADS